MSSETIFNTWNACRDWLLPALEDAPEDEVINELLTGRAQLWAGEHCAVVTQCVGSTRALHVWLAGGKLRDVIALLPGAAAWGKPLGIEQLTCSGRKGWARALRAVGFESGDDGMLRKAI